MLPKLCIPSRTDIQSLNEFTGPLLAVTVIRLLGFLNMQKAAMRLGVNHMASYQLSVNIIFFFLLFAEPLSQLSQTKLPSLLDVPVNNQVRATLKSILFLGASLSLGIGAIAAFTLKFGTSLFSSDLAVQTLSKNLTPAVFFTVTTAIFAVTVDGALLASKEFGYMIGIGTFSALLQWRLLQTASSVFYIYTTFTLRLGVYAIGALIRMALGRGTLGRNIRHKSR